MVTTGTICFPHFGQRVIRSMTSSRFFEPNDELERLFQSNVSVAPCSEQKGLVVCTENLIRVDDVMESPKLAE